MVVSNEICEECKSVCNAIHFQQNFENWTSNNSVVDKFIQNVQLSAHSNNGFEWIPYDRFYDIKFIAKGGFGDVYRANWIDGRIVGWDNNNNCWRRNGQNMFVALKSLNNSGNISLEFMNEV
jgi:hypothetical protein